MDTLPKAVTPEIRAFCGTIAGGEPIFLPSRPQPDAITSFCFDNVARQIRTGQGDFKVGTMTQQSVRDAICEQLEIIVADGCPGLKIDLREYTTFKQAADMTIVYSGSGSDRELAGSNFAFTPGKSMTKNMLRTFYEWPVMTDFMRKAMSNLKGGKTLHFASVTWQNEPFDD